MDAGIVTELANLITALHSMAYDVKGRYVYASRYAENAIVKFPYPNDQAVYIEIVVKTNRPYSVAFDSGNSHIYWTEYTFFGRIVRCNSDGSSLTTFVSVLNPFGLSIDTQNRWIYHSEGNALHRVTFDGLEDQVLVNPTANPIDIDIDFGDKRFYWMEYDTGDLKSALYNGSDVKTVVSTCLTFNSRDIVIVNDYIYYTSYRNILKIHKSSGQMPTVVHTEPSDIFGVLFYTQEGKL